MGLFSRWGPDGEPPAGSETPAGAGAPRPDAAGSGPAARGAGSPRPPTAAELAAALDATSALVAGGAVPSVVAARVQRVVATARDTIPRLDQIGAGSADGYAVMATATHYLPEAVGGYLRLPRRFADTRPVDRGRTSLMVLVDQLDLLGQTMDQVFDAVCRDDANALVAHGMFLHEKFGADAAGGMLEMELGTPVPAPPGPVTSTSGTSGTGEPDSAESDSAEASPGESGPAESRPAESRPAESSTRPSPDSVASDPT